MAELRNFQTGTQSGVMIDQGLRSYMLKVYNLMMFGVGITGVAAYVTTLLTTTNDPSQAAATMRGGVMLTQLGVALYTSPLQWVVMLAPLALVFFLSFRIDKMSVSAAQGTFWAYAALLGVSLSSILLVYTAASITQTFFVTAASFGALSLYGYTTKRDLSGMGSFLVMGLFGIILASIVNIFLKSAAINFVVSALGVVIFTGLTAWDTQKIKNTYYQIGGDTAVAGKAAIMGALSLYLDFLNIFLFLLRFMGNRR